MDVAQWAGYAISALFGGAGGIAGGLAKFAGSISALEKSVVETKNALEKRMLELEHENRVQATKLADHQQYHEEASQERYGDIEQLQAQLTALRDAMDTGKTNQMEYEATVQRALGAIEGTVNQIARNGCARACNPGMVQQMPPSPSPGRYSVSYPSIPAATVRESRDPRGRR